MTTLRRTTALILAFLPAVAGAVEFKDTPAPERLPIIVPIGPGVVGGFVPPSGVAETAKVSVPETGVIPQIVPTAAATPVAPGAEAKTDVVTPIVAGVQPQLEAIAKPGTGTETSAGAGENVTTILQGGKAETPTVITASAGNAGPGTAPLTKSEGSKVAAPVAPAAPETTGKGPKPINSMLGYKIRRAALAAIATHWGIVYSMPPASPALTERILRQEARNADVIYSDIDDTLTKFNTKLPRAQAENIEMVLSAGKVFAAITDRPDKSKPGSSSMGALETMSTLYENKRMGLIVATNGGGKIYEYDKNGEPQLIYEEPSLPETERPLINEAAEVVKSQLAANGTGIFEKNPGGPGPYGYSMIFNGGTPEATVKKLAHVFEAELRKRGLDYEVEGRMAKDPTLPPYITFSKLNKSLAVKRIMEVKKLQDKKALGMGDSMYAPVKPADLTGWKAKTAPWALKLGAMISGSEIPLTGNRTDANMEHGNPGMTMLSVGTTGDPRMKNGYVLAGKGPEVAAKILVEAARQRAGQKTPSSDLEWAAILALFVLGVAVYAVLAYGFSSWVAEAEQQLRQMPEQFRNMPHNGPWPF